MGERWEGTFEDDLTQKRPVEEHLQMMLTFAQEHETTLKTILSQTRNTMCEASESHYRLIRPAFETLERVYPQDFLYSTDIPEVNVQQYANISKVILTFVYLQDEIHELKNIAETKFYYPLMMFGQLPVYRMQGSNNDLDGSKIPMKTSTSLKPGEKELMIGIFLPFLQELSNFVERCYRVAMNLVQQLGVFMNQRELIYKRLFQFTHMISLFQSLGELLCILVTFDLAIQQNDLLLDYWSHYKSMVTVIRNNATNFDTSDDEVSAFERLIVSIDQSLMIGEIFKGCIEQDFDDISSHGPLVIKHESVRQNTLLLADMLSYIKSNLDSCLNVINSTTEHKEKQGVMASMALYVLYRQLLPANQPPDAKLHKVLWNVQKIVPFVILYDKIIWTIPEFLQMFLFFDMKKLEITNPIAFRRTWMTTFDSQLSIKTAHLIAQCNAWYIICESKLQASLRYEVSNILGSLDMYASILLKGLNLASKASYLANTMLTMHSTMQIPLTKSHCADLASLIEHLKAIEYSLVRKDYIFAEVLPHIIRHHVDEILNFFKPIKLKLESLRLSTKTSMVGGVDNYVKICYVLFVMVLLENLLKSTDNFTSLRQIILNYFTEIISYSSLLGNEKEVSKLRLFIKRILSLSTLTNDLREACNTQFLYYHLDLLPTILQGIYTSTTEGNRLQYILAGFCDGVRMIQASRHLEHGDKDIQSFYASYRYSLKDVLTKELILPLCHHIETDLRLHVHMKHLPHMQTYNPKFSNDTSSASMPSNPSPTISSTSNTTGTTVTGSIGTTVLRSYATFLSIPSLFILGQIVTIQDEIAHHLNKTFYNLTTITLHDWKMYAEMKSLAYEKYNLKLLNNFLPMGSLDQGLDVLQIMR
jgi:WASH complex subunit 7